MANRKKTRKLIQEYFDVNAFGTPGAIHQYVMERWHYAPSINAISNLLASEKNITRGETVHVSAGKDSSPRLRQRVWFRLEVDA